MPRVKVRGVLVVISLEGSSGQELGTLWLSLRDCVCEFSQVVVRVGGGACIAAWWEEGLCVLVGEGIGSIF